MAIEPWREEPWAPFVRTYERVSVTSSQIPDWPEQELAIESYSVIDRAGQRFKSTVELAQRLP